MTSGYEPRYYELAFPRPHVVADANDPNFKAGEKGMSLRDYFAGQALVGLLSNPESFRAVGLMAQGKQDSPSLMCAQSAYDLADAMLEARDK